MVNQTGDGEFRQSQGEQGRGLSANAEAQARNAAEQAKHAARDAAQQTKHAALDAAEQAKQAAMQARDAASSIVQQQKDYGAEQMEGIARAAHGAADQLEEQLPMAASYVHDAAARLERASATLRERSIEELLGSISQFARTQPAVLFGGAVIAGFALSRFLKSSASHSAGDYSHYTMASPRRGEDYADRHNVGAGGVDDGSMSSGMTGTGSATPDSGNRY